eukprot:3517627-Pleurochrysis_carterae.AAC.1
MNAIRARAVSTIAGMSLHETVLDIVRSQDLFIRADAGGASGICLLPRTGRHVALREVLHLPHLATCSDA